MRKAIFGVLAIIAGVTIMTLSWTTAAKDDRTTQAYVAPVGLFVTIFGFCTFKSAVNDVKKEL